MLHQFGAENQKYPSASHKVKSVPRYQPYLAPHYLSNPARPSAHNVRHWMPEDGACNICPPLPFKIFGLMKKNPGDLESQCAAFVWS